MTEEQPVLPESIVAFLNSNYGIKATKLVLLPLGADFDVCVYKAETHDGPSYFVKLKRGHCYDVSIAVLSMLQALGIEQIIPPIKTIKGELRDQLNDFSITVYPFVHGRNGFDQCLIDQQWIALGKALRQIHTFDVPQSIKDQMRIESYSGKWREAVRLIDAQIEGSPNGDEAAMKLRALMLKHRGVIRRLVDRAESLSRMIQDMAPEFVLCHSDIHGGNVLIDDNGSIFIVDWDDPMMAPKERDLMFIGGGVANVWNNPLEVELFYKGYGKTEINRTILAYYRHERIVEDIADYAQALLLNTTGGEERMNMFKQFSDMFEANGVIDIAFQTDIEL